MKILTSIVVAGALILGGPRHAGGQQGSVVPLEFKRMYQEMTLTRCVPLIKFCNSGFDDVAKELPDEDAKFKWGLVCAEAKLRMKAALEADPNAAARIERRSAELDAEFSRLPKGQQSLRLSTCTEQFLYGK